MHYGKARSACGYGILSAKGAIPDEYQAAVLALADIWARSIPLSQHMAVQICADDDRGLILRAPLDPNSNHHGTAFGGSLSAIATLAGWGVASAALGDPTDAQVIIGSQRMRFLRPISGDFEAVCPWPGPDKVEAFVERVHLRGRGEIELQVELKQQNERAAVFRGRYLAFSHWAD